MDNSSFPERENVEAAHADKNNDRLNRIATTGSISVSPELFEQLYLAPKTRVKGELRHTFGNPTPIGLSLICVIR
jgi:hypothetical protein